LSFLYDYLGQHGLAVTKPHDLMNLDAHGRNLVSSWLKRMSKFIAEAVTHIGLVVDPDAVVVGGRLPVRMVDELLRYVNERLDAADRNLPSIHRATTEDAAALGAAAMSTAARLMLSSVDPAQRTRLPLQGIERIASS
jgi:predicted NBD/HSP70 family sugar kinase